MLRTALAAPYSKLWFPFAISLRSSDQIMRIALCALIAVAVWWGWDDWQRREINHAPGLLVTTEPKQRDLASAASFRHGKYTLTPRAEFSLSARVLATERYRFDPLADLIPRDLALGWGAMSDTTVLAGLQISQSGRFYFWRTRTGELPAPVETITASSANMHLIAADPGVARVIERARVGHVIELEGQLVDVRADNGYTISTSLTRSDSGAGACEVIYVQRAVTR
jgi:hypothetical protein